MIYGEILRFYSLIKDKGSTKNRSTSVMELLEYKDYCGLVNASLEDSCLYGKLEFIRPLVNFEGQTIAKLVKSFHKAVDDYLVDCEHRGVLPEKPCKGTYKVRVGHDLHLQAALAAHKNNMLLNEFTKTALMHELGQ